MKPVYLISLLAALSLVLLLPATAEAQSRNTLVPPGHLQYAPGPIPDRVILVLAQNPESSQTVNWRTNYAVDEALAQISEAHDGPGLHLTAREVTGTTRPRISENGLAHHHSVTFDGLRPNTLYAYRVRGQGTWSEWFQFRTARQGFSPFSFLYFGDAQNSVRSHFSRVIREAFLQSINPAFMLHAGDLVNLRRGIHGDEWGEWFDAGAFINAMVPSFPVAGNHEFVYQTDEAGERTRVLSEFWEAQFSVAGNGPPGHQETVYFVEYQDVLFVALDSMRAIDSEESAIVQARWLEDVLGRKDYRWVFVSHHHPIHSVSLGRDNPALREHWMPIYQRHGVDMVLQGHDHTYGRGTNIPQGAMMVDQSVGTVYVVSVAGPKMYFVADIARQRMNRLGEDVQLYQHIEVEYDRIRFESRTVTGRLYDAFHLVKDLDGRNRLEERLPPGMIERICTNPDREREDRCWQGTELVD